MEGPCLQWREGRGLLADRQVTPALPGTLSCPNLKCGLQWRLQCPRLSAPGLGGSHAGGQILSSSLQQSPNRLS